MAVGIGVALSMRCAAVDPGDHGAALLVRHVGHVAQRHGARGQLCAQGVGVIQNLLRGIEAGALGGGRKARLCRCCSVADHTTRVDDLLHLGELGGRRVGGVRVRTGRRSQDQRNDDQAGNAGQQRPG